MNKIFIFLFSTVLFSLTACSSKNPSAQVSPPSKIPASTEAKTADTKVIPFVTVFNHSRLGEVLVDRNGMALYVFKKDEAGKSNCNDVCAEQWPPLEPDGSMDADLKIKAGLGVIIRTDGVSQVTYKGAPLYRWAQDKTSREPGGDGVNGVWSVAKP